MKLRSLHPSLLILMSGLGLGISFFAFPFSVLGPVVLVPLLLRWDQLPPLEILAESYTTFLTAFAIAFFWPLLNEYPHAGVLTMGSLLFVPLCQAAPFALSAAVRRHTNRSAALAALIAFYLTVELFLIHVAFPWPVLGYTQANAVNVNQFAAFTGVQGLSLWILLLNGLAFLSIVSGTLRHRLVFGLAFFTLAGSALGYSLWHTTRPAPARTPVLSVGFVQPSLPESQWSNPFDDERVRQLLARSDSLFVQAATDLIVWPEGAVPVFGRPTWRHRIYERIQRWVNYRDVALLTGAVTPASTDSAAFSNSALFFRPGKEPVSYHQTRLVPLAERVPWSAPTGFRPPDGGVTSFAPGSGPRTLVLDSIRLGPLVGMEVTQPSYVRSAAYLDPDVFVVLTRSGWGGRTPGFSPTLAFARLRAIEAGRPVLQVANTGRSGVVDRRGRAAHITLPGTSAAHVVEISDRKETTFYVRHGNWIGWASLGLSLLALLTFLLPASSSAAPPSRGSASTTEPLRSYATHPYPLIFPTRLR